MSTLKLISWNVNGIRAAEKKGFLDWLAASGADVIAVPRLESSSCSSGRPCVTVGAKKSPDLKPSASAPTALVANGPK